MLRVLELQTSIGLAQLLVAPRGFMSHLRRFGVGEGGVTRGEVALIHAALRGRGVLAAVLHVDHGPACEKMRK